MESLQEFGLTERESRVYIALLELGSTTTGPLIKKAEVPNSKIYEVLESLHSKGLVSWIIQGKTKHFQARDPKQLRTLILAKQQKLDHLIPELELKHASSQSKRYVELFEGMKAIRSFLLSLLQDVKKNESFYGFSTGESSLNKEVLPFYVWWGALKLSVGFDDHLLISAKNQKTFESALLPQSLKALKGRLRYSKVSFPGDVAIFRNQVILFTWDSIPTATVITNEKLFIEYRDFFLEVWKMAKPAKTLQYRGRTG